MGSPSAAVAGALGVLDRLRSGAPACGDVPGSSGPAMPEACAVGWLTELLPRGSSAM